LLGTGLVGIDQYQNISYSSCCMNIRKMMRCILQHKFQACI